MLWKYSKTRRVLVSEKVSFHSKIPMRRQGGAVFQNVIFSVFFGTQDPWRIHRTDLQKFFFFLNETALYLGGGFIFTPIWGRFPIWLIFFRWVETTNYSYIQQKRTYIALHVSSLQKKCLESNIYFPKNLGPKVALKNSFRANFFWQPKKCSQPALFHAWESAFAAAATRLCLNLAPTDPDKIDAWVWAFVGVVGQGFLVPIW